MPPEALTIAPTALAERLPPVWRTAALQLGLAWLSLILVFLPDWLTMADQWWNSSTYNHIILVPVIIGWLVWQRWPQLRDLELSCLYRRGDASPVLAAFLDVVHDFARDPKAFGVR